LCVRVNISKSLEQAVASLLRLQAALSPIVTSSRQQSPAACGATAVPALSRLTNERGKAG
jgi:hypothetical protein